MAHTMAHYNSLKSLGENTLKLGDTVTLLDIKYQVRSCYMWNMQDSYNDRIFNKLGIENPKDFCKAYYGYPPNSGTWPEFRENDFSAATRVVKALFKVIENLNVVDNLNVVEASKESEKTKEVAISKSLKEEPELSVLLPSKHRSIKQVVIQKEITFNKL